MLQHVCTKLMGDLSDEILSYTVTKKLKIDIWQLGVIHRSLQFLIIIWILYGLIEDGKWAFAEQPEGTYNMYVSAGTTQSLIDGASNLSQSFKYCNDPSYSYAYSPDFRYGDPPRCRELTTGEATVKGTSDFFFVTFFDERHEFGWTCGGVDEALQYGKCLETAAGMAVRNSSRGFQCRCQTRDSYYPVGVDQMLMAMEISYSTTPTFGRYNGSTNNPESSAKGSTLEVRLFDQASRNILSHRAKAPFTSWIALSLNELIQAAGLDLDAPNVDLTPDYRTDGTAANPYRYPRFRTSGVNIKTKIDFTNTNPNVDREHRTLASSLYAILYPGDIRAEITLEPNIKQWGGLGPIMAYEQYPSGPGGRAYHKIERYRQGVVFKFVTVGHVRKFDEAHLVLQIVIAIGMMVLAKLATEMFFFRLVLDRRTRKMLRSKVRETVNETSEFAELGLKAAVAAQQYHLFDPDGNKRIELVDIAKSFARVDGVSITQAYHMAEMIMDGADSDFILRESKFSQIRNALRKCMGKEPIKQLGASDNAGLSFREFAQCLSGSTVDFAELLDAFGDPRKVDKSVLSAIKEEFDSYQPPRATPDAEFAEQTITSQASSSELGMVLSKCEGSAKALGTAPDTMRAVRDFIPQDSREVAITYGQVLYHVENLGNGWAKVALLPDAEPAGLVPWGFLAKPHVTQDVKSRVLDLIATVRRFRNAHRRISPSLYGSSRSAGPAENETPQEVQDSGG